MRQPLSDTDPEAEAVRIEALRRLGPVGRLQQAFDLSASVRQLAEARIRARYGPEIPDREVMLRLAALWLDRATMIEVFDWDPEVHGY